jgi:CO dehydrogenase maturation factor
MKIAISGKGGVGKSTLAAALAVLLARKGNKVLAIDADADANLAAALGVNKEEQKNIIPISKQAELIEERTGAKVKQYGQMFKLNPEVDDIAGKYATLINGVSLLILGAVEQGGGGCACPESVLLRALVTDLILYKKETLIMDMEAGVEHLGRATVKGVDLLIIVVEPGQHSIDSTNKIIRMAAEIGLVKIKLVANKVDGKEDEQFIRNAFPNSEIIGIIPFSDEIRKSDRSEKCVIDCVSKEIVKIFESILDKI